MAINLNKGDRLGKYSYSKNHIIYGPIQLDDLIKYVDCNTQVYVEGIGWKKAKDLTELKKYLRNCKRFYTILIFASLFVLILLVIFVFIYWPKIQGTQSLLQLNQQATDTLNFIPSVKNQANETHMLKINNIEDSSLELTPISTKTENGQKFSEEISAVFKDYANKDSRNEKTNYFISSLLPKRKEIIKLGVKNKEEFKKALIESYEGLVDLIPDTKHQDFVKYCNLRDDLEYAMEELNCHLDSNIQKKLKQKCY